jgi:hypothetical protein
LALVVTCRIRVSRAAGSATIRASSSGSFSIANGRDPGVTNAGRPATRPRTLSSAVGT